MAGLLMETILAGHGVMWMMPIFSGAMFRALGRIVRRILAAISRGGSIGRIWAQSAGYRLWMSRTTTGHVDVMNGRGCGCSWRYSSMAAVLSSQIALGS